jgi:hypothetical protein
MSTTGNSIVTIHGARLGDMFTSSVSATYGILFAEEYYSPCTVVEDNINIRCLAAPGVGANLTLVVQVS